MDGDLEQYEQCVLASHHGCLGWLCLLVVGDGVVAQSMASVKNCGTAGLHGRL